MAGGILRILRSLTPGNRPAGKTYGEPYVNIAEKQFGVIDSSNNPQDLIGVPFFSPSISYPSGAAVVYQGVLYLATTAVSAGPWNGAQWAQVQPAGGFSTGDAKLTLKNVADPTWVMMNDGQIGDPSSNATTRANNDCQSLFTLIWNNVSDTWAPVLSSTGVGTGRGASAAADWAAHRRISLTRQLGRALIIGGSGAGLTNRPLGGYGGEETHAMSLAEMVSHWHPLNDPGHLHGSYTANYYLIWAGTVNVSMASEDIGVAYSGSGFANTLANLSATTGAFANNQPANTGTPFNVMQPYTTWNIMLKL